ncbi:MAG: sensory rhodopsin transducer, partial [Clostridia bacterium]|nr:sensory rhodopsin transducer [Clostridia bacterium]
MQIGKNNWVFCDGYLPPKGNNPEFEGHEALMLTNPNKDKAKIELTLVFEDKDPVDG